jgi:hypothetical protein
MAHITAGNRLYLYQLLSNACNFDAQVPIAQVEGVLSEDGIEPEDLDCDSVQELLEALGFVRLTFFKKGRVYATVTHDEELDGIIERAGRPRESGQQAKGAKPWKHRKQKKDPTPAKPRHKEKPAPEPESEPIAEAEPEPSPEPEPASAPEPKPEEPLPVPEPAPEPQPEPEPEQNPEPEPNQEQPEAPVLEPEPTINLTITYDPYEGLEDESGKAQPTEVDEAAEPAGAPRPEPEPKPKPASATDVAGVPAHDLPETLSEELYCRDDLLRLLYQLLPVGADVMGVLDEDWRVARSTGTVSGTRGKVTFPLRYRTEAGEPVEVTIKRASKAPSGKHWALALVMGDDGTGTAHAAATTETAPATDTGAWVGLANNISLPVGEQPNPIREFAQFATIGSWDAFLGTLATAAMPERWNYPDEGVGRASRYGILREYVAVTFHRAQLQHRVAIAADGSIAAFDTGLLTPFGEDLYACFDPQAGDIAWHFAGFSTAGDGELGARMASALEELPKPPTYLTRISDVLPEQGRTLVLDTDALLGWQLGRLPRAFLTEGVAANSEASGLLEHAFANAGPTGNAPEDVLALARVIKGDPGLFRKMRRQLEDAVTTALRLARASYRIAAPAYDPVSDVTKLLLPLSLVSEGTADCAIVLERLGSGNLRAEAVMSLPRAYACARVISAEQPRWLDPDVVLA